MTEKPGMRGWNGFFLMACCGLLAGLIWTYSVFVQYFGTHDDDRIQADHYATLLREEKFRRDLAEARIRDLGQEVAAALPAERELKGRLEKLREISTVTREPAALPVDLSGVRLRRAKDLFAEDKWAEAGKEFQTLIRDFPTSPHVVESYFLWAEAAFKARDEKRVIEIADLMINQFPDQDLTGFVLLRLGQVNETNGREAEAAEIYATVRRSFRDQRLKDQARRMSQALESQ